MGLRRLIQLLVLAALSNGCIEQLVEMPQDTRVTEMTELHFRHRDAVVTSATPPPNAPQLQGTKRVSYYEDPLSEFKHGSMTFDAAASDFVAARQITRDDLMRLHLNVIREHRHYYERKALWVTTPWANVSEIRKRVTYRNGTAPLMVFLGIPLCTAGALFAFVLPRDVNPSAATTDRVIGGTLALTGIITSVAGAVYALKPDDVMTVWPAAGQP